MLAAMIATSAVTITGLQRPDESSRKVADAAGQVHHAIRTPNGDTQILFDEGLTFYYGFNRDAAHRAFLRAAQLDSQAAMPLVGVALSLGPNLNMDADAPQLRTACDTSRAALQLAQNDAERGYATAVLVRYCTVEGRVSASAYVDALNELRRNVPDDPDAAVLYADSLLQLRPRSLEQDAEIVSVLEAVLRRRPSHIGANHLYIHAVEGSENPMRAMESAHRLETLASGIGHLLHMPSHIYMRTGGYEASIAGNLRAAAADLAYLQRNPPGRDGAMYYLHDLESLSVALGFDGRYAEAHAAAREIERVEAGLKGESMQHGFSAPLAFVFLRFHKWPEAAAVPLSDDEALSSLLGHFARTAALVGFGRLSDATRERDAFDRAAAAMPRDAIYRSNRMSAVTEVLKAVLLARFEQATDGAAPAIDAWQRAVDAQDRLVYHEPPPFYYPVRETLGAVLLAAGRGDSAERVFRDDLAVHPGNGRSLFGLWHALTAQGRNAEAERIHQQFLAAWTRADVELSLSAF